VDAPVPFAVEAVTASAAREDNALVISIRCISLGGGFRYLMDSVARGDGAAEASSSLAAYYAEPGTPLGVFLGAGLADLDGGAMVKAGTRVTEEHARC